jgi:hypothetical protein
MIRLALRLSLLFMLPILIIRAQAYNDHGLRSLLASPADCESPCFLGVQPAITTQEEAIQRFKAVEHINYVVGPFRDAHTTILWRDTQNPYSGSLRIEDNIVTEITIQGFRLQDVWLLLGEPNQGTMHYENIYLEQNDYFRFAQSYEGEYSNHGFNIMFNLSCDSFWVQLVTVSITSSSLRPSASSDSLALRRRETCTNERDFRHVDQNPTTP